MQRRSLVHTLVLTAGVALSALGNSAILAQQAPITRTILQQEDLAGVPGREVVMLRAEIAPGAIAAKHFHPGPEVVYILSGSLLVEPDGQPPVTLQEGDSMHLPARQPHSARNTSSTAPVKVIVFLVGEKGQPLATPVQ